MSTSGPYLSTHQRGTPTHSKHMHVHTNINTEKKKMSELRMSLMVSSFNDSSRLMDAQLCLRSSLCVSYSLLRKVSVIWLRAQPHDLILM